MRGRERATDRSAAVEPNTESFFEEIVKRGAQNHRTRTPWPNRRRRNRKIQLAVADFNLVELVQERIEEAAVNGEKSG